MGAGLDYGVNLDKARQTTHFALEAPHSMMRMPQRVPKNAPTKLKRAILAPPAAKPNMGKVVV